VPVNQTRVSFTAGLFRRRIEFPLGFGVKKSHKEIKVKSDQAGTGFFTGGRD
jgi:hypothetical protein